ncbi:hypothetical protein LCGC14_1920660, partial [marine sediment metagenome]
MSDLRHYDVITSPVITEKSTLLSESNQVVFNVPRTATKPDIKAAVEALFGVNCNTGDTFTSEGLELAMSSMFVPEPVISLAITPKDKKAEERMAKALGRFSKEDPTFRSYVDPESNETIVQGMGELHLDVYIKRMRREYGADVETGAPQVAYRE